MYACIVCSIHTLNSQLDVDPQCRTFNYIFFSCICSDNREETLPWSCSEGELSSLLCLQLVLSLPSFLQFGRQLIENFLRLGMPLLYAVFRTKQDEVLVILKSLQQSTRSLQHFCGHSKVHCLSTNRLLFVSMYLCVVFPGVVSVYYILRVHSDGWGGGAWLCT